MDIFTKLKFFVNKEIKYRKLKNLNPKHYKSFLEKEYFERTGEQPNLDKPRKYTEKMQYAKVHLNSSLKTKLSDKYAVRSWVGDKIGKKYLIPLIDVWENVKRIDFDNLPKQYVLKTTTGSGTNVIVRDNDNLDRKKTKLKLKYWTNRNFAFDGDLQLHYADITPKIIAEEYITDKNDELTDYKFMCFNGSPYFVWIDFGRYTNHYRNVYDLNWNLQNWNQNEFENTPFEIKKPKNFTKMIEIATILSEGFSHVRVDLYNVDGEIYFGEMTFTNGGGFDLIKPDKYNYLLGDLWDITGRN